MQDLPLNRIIFGLAILIYAVFGSPTPDHFGLAEITILMLLFTSIRPEFSYGTGRGWLLAGYGLSLPLLVALIAGYPIAEIIRDIVPFLFLLMPVLYSYREEYDTEFISLSVISVGLIFSIRSLFSFGENIFNPQEWLGTPPDLLYLANSPEVLFAAIALLYRAWQSDAKLRVRVICFLLSLLPLVAMTTLMQRASLFYILMVLAALFIVRIWRNPRSAVGMAGIILIIIWTSFSFIDNIFAQLSFKTQMVGLNSRGAEWRAVYDEVSASVMHFLFGRGWGAEFENPAVGNLRVSFTHSLLSSMLLKTGLVGVIIFLIYGFDLIKKSVLRLRQERIYLYALAGPLLIGLCLYASYKSLGYGLLLLLLASLVNGKKLDKAIMPVP